MTKVLFLIILFIIADRSLAADIYKCRVLVGPDHRNDKKVPNADFKYSEITGFHLKKIHDAKDELVAIADSKKALVGKGKITVATDITVITFKDTSHNHLLTMNKVSSYSTYEGYLTLSGEYSFEINCNKSTSRD